jgi:hypothetical protein
VGHPSDPSNAPEPEKLHVQCSGMPHVATDERDVGHPASVVRLREQRRIASSAMLLPYTKAKEHHAKER